MTGLRDDQFSQHRGDTCHVDDASEAWLWWRNYRNNLYLSYVGCASKHDCRNMLAQDLFGNRGEPDKIQ